jgi:drug/metabolite transporter (DMT)-like permease
VRAQEQVKNDLLLLNEIEVNKDSNREKDGKIINKINNKCLPFKAYILAILSAFFFCLSNVILRMLTTLTPSDNAFINYMVWGLVVFIIAKYNKVNVFGTKEQKILLHFRGIIGVFALLSIYTGLKFIDPSDVVSITHASLIITAALARGFLKEKLTIAHFVSTILTILGILLICKPKFLFKTNSFKDLRNQSSFNLNSSSEILNFTMSGKTDVSENINTVIGVSICLLGAFALGVVQIVMKKLCIKKCHYTVLTLYAVYYGAPISLAISLIFIFIGKSHQNTSNELNTLYLHIFYSICVGLLGVCGQISINLAFSIEDATKIAIIRTTGKYL